MYAVVPEPSALQMPGKHVTYSWQADLKCPRERHINKKKGRLESKRTVHSTAVLNGLDQDRKINLCFIEFSALETPLPVAPDEG